MVNLKILLLFGIVNVFSVMNVGEDPSGSFKIFYSQRYKV